VPPTDPRSDEQLIAAANAGDPAAFEALYLRYRDWVLRLACRFTGDHDAALDVLQETFLYFLRKFPGFHLTARLTTFLYPAVRNLALADRRKRNRAGDPAPLDALPAPPSPPPGVHDDLQAVLAILPDLHREVLLMRCVDDLSLAEIAAALGVPLGTVKSRLHAALERLRADPRAARYFAPDH
jgi:RNA polymerase sigma-70 factor (ECF subfamily)